MKGTLASIAVLFLVVGCGGGQGASDGNDADTPRGGSADASQGDHAVPHWGYEKDDGPDRWGEMSEAWSACATGQRQSPIDVGNAKPGDIPATTMSFPPVDLHIVHQEHVLDVLDNGHTIQVNYDGGETLSFGEETYQLLQYHFHSPSEHTVDGEHYPMEMHLVHQGDAGKLAVIGVFIEEGEHNHAFDVVWQNLPDEKGEQVHVEDVQIDIDDMLPDSSTSYRYDGSLTTPPCSEDVRWIVMTEPIRLGSGQINAFREVFTGNNRPPQPLNDREVLTDRVRGS
jgi:carbonic anhydrase